MTAKNIKILIIEDEPKIRLFLNATLSSEEYELFEASTGAQGLIDAKKYSPDLLIIDIGLPDINGIDVIKQLRTWATFPILVLSARSQEEDKVLALDSGADDYLTKPFGVQELLARIRVALRHLDKSPSQFSPTNIEEQILTLGQLKLDFASRRFFLNEKEVKLTPIEYKILAELAKNLGKVVTHKLLLKNVWGPTYVEENHYLRIYMRQLRHKIEPDPTCPRYLITETGVGYRLLGDEQC